MQPGDDGSPRPEGFAPLVVDAVRRDVAELERRLKGIKDSALAATALALAAEIDDPGNSATSKSMCARALTETLDRLRELAPAEAAGDKLDDLSARREKRLVAASR